MKESKLKQRISELEVERNEALAYQKVLEESMSTIIDQLLKHGIYVNADIPGNSMIDSTTLGDAERKLIRGKVDGIPVLIFDFTEHDMRVLEKRGVIE